MKENPSETQFALYFKNKGCANLKKGKIYKILPHKEAAQNGCLRVIDESGKNRAYPKSYFILLECGPLSWRKKICLSLRGCNIEFLSSEEDVQYPLTRLDTNKRTWLLWLLLRLALPLLFLFSWIKYKPQPAYDTKTWISKYLHLLAVELLLIFKHLMGTEITSRLPYPIVETLWIQILIGLAHLLSNVVLVRTLCRTYKNYEKLKQVKRFDSNIPWRIQNGR